MGKYINEWEKSRKKGRLKYALIQGVIFAIVATLIMDRAVIWNLVKGNETDVSILFIDFLWLFIGATIGFYFLVWWLKERLYKKEKKKISS